ncbi:MAG: hypothetical protein J4F36_07795 [Nitrosopumilaceae archaeon]|nr:hypothetical protein [Nitrosopumilaceae archaeon]
MKSRKNFPTRSPAKNCKRCGFFVKNPKAECWDDNICPRCFLNLSPIIEEKNSNTLLTKRTLVDPSQITIYLNNYASRELIKQGRM